MWGLSTSIDLVKCDPILIKSDDAIKKYVAELISDIDMIAFGDPIVVHFGSCKRLAGYTIIQLIETSSIVGHFVDDTNIGFIDIFSCKTYKAMRAIEMTKAFFRAEILNYKIFERGV